MADESHDTESEGAKLGIRFIKASLFVLACLFCALCATNCVSPLGSSNSTPSSSSSATHNDDDDEDEEYDDDEDEDDDYSSYSSSSSSSSSSYSSSSSSSSSSTLLDEDDWVDTEDGKTYLKSKSEDGGTDYIDTDGEYAIHRNSDGTGAIADNKGNRAVDSDGDGKIDAYSTNSGRTWHSYR